MGIKKKRGWRRGWKFVDKLAFRPVTEAPFDARNIIQRQWARVPVKGGEEEQSGPVLSVEEDVA